MENSRFPIRIVVSDDHPVVLMGVKALVASRHQSLRVVGEATSGGELLVLLEREPCDLLVTDFAMPDGDGGDGLTLLRRVRRKHPRLPVIVLTMVSNPALVRGMFTAGVNGLVGKAALTRELLLAVQAVMHGRTYLSEQVRASLAKASVDIAVSRQGAGLAVNRAMLSGREAEVLRLYASGLSVTQIAGKLHRSVKTVSQQKSDAMRKLGLANSSQLYDYARVCGPRF